VVWVLSKQLRQPLNPRWYLRVFLERLDVLLLESFASEPGQ
jgi:hypothetical protein